MYLESITNHNNPFKAPTNTFYMLKKVAKRPLTKQFLSFILVGATSTVLNYLVFLVFLLFLSFHYLASASIGFISGVIIGFIFNKNYTFSSKRKVSKSLPVYFLIYLFSLGVNLVLLEVLTTNTSLGAIISNLLLAPLIILINFLGAKLVAFGDTKW